MPLPKLIYKFLHRHDSPGLSARQKALYDLLRNSRDVAARQVPVQLRKEFLKKMYSDQILEASTLHLISTFEAKRIYRYNREPDPWMHNEYVANYLRGLLQIGDFDQRIRNFNGNPELIAETMANGVSSVAFWMPRNN
tara:strand:- start:48 stop:461 length:414 start_codon:yes stop_codon:yes gene_type:complete